MIFFPEGCRGDIPQTRVTTLTPPAEAEKAYYASIGNDDLAA
ncbi:hypothetical protein [Shigella dysenteriae]|nr:hypothetical protein [Shigella dysenteriae]